MREIRVSDDLELLIDRRGALGILTLNRLETANALSLGMIRGIASGLADFARDPKIGAVLIRAEGRTFSSGGDVLAILSYTPGPELERFRRDYFAAEYALNYRIHTYPKPYIAVIDGLTIGGGCGLSLHGSHVVASERTLISMPETTIGHFPDVGATWFLNRLPGEMGVYIGLKGLRLGASDAVALGLATHYVGSDHLPALSTALAGQTQLDAAAVDAILAGFVSDPGASALMSRQERVDKLFGGATVEAIVVGLETAKESWAEAALGVLRHASPRSLKVTLKMLREGRGLSIEEALRTEYRICVRVTGSHDFREGVRAALIDKDNRPHWQPDRLEALGEREVEAYFAPLAPAEPELDLGW